jgi:hypothetical protein
VIDSQRSCYAGYVTRELAVEGTGPKFVLLHGFGHPGFGHADDTRRGRKLPQLDAFVAEVIAQHGSREPVTVIGNSLGGLMAVGPPQPGCRSKQHFRCARRDSVGHRPSGLASPVIFDRSLCLRTCQCHHGCDSEPPTPSARC